LELEEAADEMLRESLEGCTKYSEKSDVLTAWKLQMRETREILTSSGFPERHIRQGMYHRAANLTKPELNSRDGVARARSSGHNTTAQTHTAYTGYHDEEV
jgi:hypothetical protein